MSDSFRTVSRSVQVELARIRGSLFIGHVVPVDTAAATQAQLGKIKSLRPDASHHCYAFRLLPDQFRTSDDGEPSGTAGRPILRQIDARELTNLLLVVTRYFGGTKLGTGGLVRAYGAAAGAVLDRADIATMVRTTRLRLIFDYADTALALQYVESRGTPVVEGIYTEQTVLVVDVPASQVSQFAAGFKDALRGRGRSEVL